MDWAVHEEPERVVVRLSLSLTQPLVGDLLLTEKSIGNQSKSGRIRIQTVQTGGYKMARQPARAVSLRSLSAVSICNANNPNAAQHTPTLFDLNAS